MEMSIMLIKVTTSLTQKQITYYYSCISILGISQRDINFM